MNSMLLFGFMFGTPGFIEMIFIAGMLVVYVMPFWMIFQKAGFPGALSLLMLLPCINIIILFYVAFSDWPALRDRRQDDFDEDDEVMTQVGQ